MRGGCGRSRPGVAVESPASLSRRRRCPLGPQTLPVFAHRNAGGRHNVGDWCAAAIKKCILASMFIALHVAVALLSVAVSTVLFFAPSKTKLYVSYSLTALTLLSGTYLVVSKPARMLETCTMGLLYIGFAAISVVVAQRKLSNEKALNKD